MEPGHLRDRGALQIASALQPIWVTRGWIGEGKSWLDAALADADRRMRGGARGPGAGACRPGLDRCRDRHGPRRRAEQALAIAREIGDPALLARALIASGAVYGFKPEVAGPFFAEGIELARSVDDGWLVGYVLGWQSVGAVMAGYPAVALEIAREGRALADSNGDCSCRGSVVSSSVRRS